MSIHFAFIAISSVKEKVLFIELHLQFRLYFIMIYPEKPLSSLFLGSNLSFQYHPRVLTFLKILNCSYAGLLLVSFPTDCFRTQATIFWHNHIKKSGCLFILDADTCISSCNVSLLKTVEFPRLWLFIITLKLRKIYKFISIYRQSAIFIYSCTCWMVTSDSNKMDRNAM